MTPDITIKRNDAGKILAGQLLDSDGVAVDCTGFTTAKIFWRSFADEMVKINGETISFDDEQTGSWQYSLVADDVDTSGWYKMEIEVGFPAGVKQTFPTDRDRPYLLVLVQDDLG